MGGVAAKARCAYHDGSWATRRSTRGRHRNTVPKPLKIPAKVIEEPEAKSAPLVSSQQCQPSPVSSLQLLPLPEPLQPLEFETDTETETEVGVETGTLVSDVDMEHDKLTVTETHLSDFSNYLGISRRGDDDNASVTIVDSDAYTRASSVEDVYGWDAELDRQAKCGFSRTDSMCSCHYPCGKVDSGKRGLLQRVFSVPARRVNSGF
ncbi:hypothetical protein F4818DRAFT_11469 [Hypoxylon cercidicola]|nr:hypothetical protein F4818DRAFT_11469 [Hypoxylon cercidicola]